MNQIDEKIILLARIIERMLVGNATNEDLQLLRIIGGTRQESE